MVYFPVYTREEMLDIVPHARSTKSSECQVIGEAWVDKVLERFDGNLRVLFGNDQYFGDRCSEQDKKINALAQNKVWRPVEELPKMSSTIVKLCPPNKVGARFVYKYLSKYVQVMVSFQMELTKLHQIKSFIDVNQAVNWFETLCHNVVQRGDKFTMKKLPATKSHRTFDIGLERFGQTQSYRDFEELKKSRKSDKSVYWYPVNPNCAAVDSIGRNAGWSSGTPFDKSHPTGFQYTTDKNASKKKKTINLDGAWNLVVSLGLLTEGRHYRPSRIKPGKLLNYVLVVPPQLFSSFDRPLKFKRTVKKHTGIADEKEIKKQQVKDEEIDEKKIIILKQLIKQYVVTCANLDSGLH